MTNIIGFKPLPYGGEDASNIKLAGWERATPEDIAAWDEVSYGLNDLTLANVEEAKRKATQHFCEKWAKEIKKAKEESFRRLFAQPSSENVKDVMYGKRHVKFTEEVVRPEPGNIAWSAQNDITDWTPANGSEIKVMGIDPAREAGVIDAAATYGKSAEVVFIDEAGELKSEMVDFINKVQGE